MAKKEYLPVFQPGAAVTFTAGEAVTAGQLVEVSGNYLIKPATAKSTKVVGVVAETVKAGERVTVFSGGVQRVEVDGAVTAGARVEAAAAGKAAVADSGDGIGLVLSGSSGAGFIEVALR